jgi:hypothetical protein
MVSLRHVDFASKRPVGSALAQDIRFLHKCVQAVRHWRIPLHRGVVFVLILFHLDVCLKSHI